MRTPWLIPLLIVLVMVAAAALLVFSGEQRRTGPPTTEMTRPARLLNECLRMYVTDFDAFPPTREAKAVQALLLPYVALRSRDLLPGGRGEVRGLRVEYLYRPGMAKAEIADRSTFQMARFRQREVGTVVAYADGHLEWQAR